jgi:hypothetical protein
MKISKPAFTLPLAAAVLGFSVPVRAQTNSLTPSTLDVASTPVQLPTVVVVGREANLVGSADSATEERGNVKLTSLSECGDRRFNGAALSGARKSGTRRTRRN